MDGNAWVAVITAIGAALVAIITTLGILLRQMLSLKHEVNSKMDRLVESAFSAGASAERDRVAGNPDLPSRPKSKSKKEE